MSGLLTELGIPGVLLLLGWLTTVGYWVSRAWRPDATWYSDLAWARTAVAARARRPQEPAPRRVSPMDGLWPKAEIGPRMWRWPLNLTRWFCEQLWRFCHRIPGLLGLIARCALYPSVGLGAAAAMAQALVLMAIFTAPVAALLFVVDSATVLRGGLPPARAGHARKAARFHQRQTQAATERLALVRQQLGAGEGARARGGGWA